MKGSKHTFSTRQAASGLFMILALLWLTVSTPFVYAANEAQKIEQGDNGCDETNPFSNTTEEKNESSVSSLSEYLHDGGTDSHNFTILTKYYKCHPADLYFEFHPELISPPPEA